MLSIFYYYIAIIFYFTALILDFEKKLPPSYTFISIWIDVNSLLHLLLFPSVRSKTAEIFCNCCALSCLR